MLWAGERKLEVLYVKLTLQATWFIAHLLEMTKDIELCAAIERQTWVVPNSPPPLVSTPRQVRMPRAIKCRQTPHASPPNLAVLN